MIVKCEQRAKLMKKRRTTIYIDQIIWDKFIHHLIEKHGKTHGGVISEEIENAIKLLIKQGTKENINHQKS
jgi:hypothetical protein